MRKVYIDISMIMVGTRFTGIPRVVMELAKRIKGDADLEFTYIEYNLSKDCYEIIDAEKFVEFCDTRIDNRRKMRTGKYVKYSEFESGSIFFDVDTVWKTRVRRSYLYPILKENNVEIISHIYDIIPITHPEYCLVDDGLNFADFVASAIKYASRIIVNSDTTSKYIKEVCAKIKADCPKIVTVPLGGNFAKKDIDTPTTDRIQKIIDNGPFLLMVGTVEPRKNHKVLIDALDKGLDDKMQVVIAGFPGHGSELVIDRINNHEQKDKRLWYISDATDIEVDALYKNCFAVAFSSYIEGYGLPIMEAITKGVPVIASDTDINREIAGDRAVYFGADNPIGLCRIVSELIGDENKYKELIRKLEGFVPPTWEECAEKMCQALKDE